MDILGYEIMNIILHTVDFSQDLINILSPIVYSDDTFVDVN